MYIFCTKEESMGQKIKMDMVKGLVVPRIATGLLSQLKDRKYIEIDRFKLIQMDALVTEEKQTL